jgi:FAD/FMN-containing dehydrogenase
MTVRAGTTLKTTQEAASAAGFELVSRRTRLVSDRRQSRDECGQQSRHQQPGTARDQVLGLEAVIASRAVLNSMTRMTENNTGCDLKQLFIGSRARPASSRRRCWVFFPHAGGGIRRSSRSMATTRR